MTLTARIEGQRINKAQGIIHTIRKYECPIKKEEEEEEEEESTNEIIYYLARGIFYFFYEIPGTNINNDAIHNDAI